MALFSKMIAKGYCNYVQLKEMSLEDLFEIIKMLDWQDYLDAEIARKTKELSKEK